MSAPEKPDLARGWKSVETLVEEEADRLAHLSDSEFDREIATESAPNQVASVDALLGKAKARAAADPEGVRSAHRALAVRAAERAAAERAAAESPKPAAARAARRWAPWTVMGTAAAVALVIVWPRPSSYIVGSPPDEVASGTPWLHYVSYVFGGAFLANAIPHWVSGVMGRSFQSPFANPPGDGLSSSTVNVLWGAFNLAMAYVLFVQVGLFDLHNFGHVAAAVVGAFAISFHLSRRFGRLHGGWRPPR